MSLGMKQLTKNPWEGIDSKYLIESKHVGKVTNYTNFGIFLEMEEGIDGLVHISDLSWTKKINILLILLRLVRNLKLLF